MAITDMEFPHGTDQMVLANCHAAKVAFPNSVADQMIIRQSSFVTTPTRNGVQHLSHDQVVVPEELLLEYPMFNDQGHFPFQYKLFMSINRMIPVYCTNLSLSQITSKWKIWADIPLCATSMNNIS